MKHRTSMTLCWGKLSNCKPCCKCVSLEPQSSLLQFEMLKLETLDVIVNK